MASRRGRRQHHLPAAIGLGETWDTEILHQVGATEGYEARYNFQRNTFAARGARSAEAPPAAATAAGAIPRGPMERRLAAARAGGGGGS